MHDPEAYRLTQIVPSERQVCHQQTEFYAFIHFTVNTFTDREWGDGTESPEVFQPTELDARQWVREIRQAGMKGLILTCKHHDGFCLWPSRLTSHSVASSPYKNGHGDVVREVSDACREAGLRFGIYLSPWDRNSALYGEGKPYDDYFVGQLTELLTGYGPIFSVWFDGACGEGPQGKKQYYDWDRYYQTVRSLQPMACISVCGPDVRWCGNEAGDTRDAEWSVVPKRTADTEKVASASQHEDQAEFRQRKISAKDRDLGSREMLKDEHDLIWYPAEVNTSIRPGWFWHESENSQVRPLTELISIYEHSVGGNATFLLNIPPDRRGLLHEQDVQRLHEFGDWIRRSFTRNLLQQYSISCHASSVAPGSQPEYALTSDSEAFWMAEEEQAVFTADWHVMERVTHIVLSENIRCSQRIEQFCIDLLTEHGWKEIAAHETVGYKYICPVASVSASAVRIRIHKSRLAPTLSFVGVYSDCTP